MQTNHKLVMKLMKIEGLTCQLRKKRYRSYKGQGWQNCPKSTQQKLHSYTTESKWVTDVTEFKGEKDEQAARQALARAGIPELAGAYVDQLSGGEGQLVLIARALAQEPRVLLLDEPSAHLDLGNKYRLMQTLSDLRKHGTTILMTTHDPEIALAVSDETVLVDGSGSVTVGTPAQLLTTESLSRLYHLPEGALEIRPSHTGIVLRRL